MASDVEKPFLIHVRKSIAIRGSIGRETVPDPVSRPRIVARFILSIVAYGIMSLSDVAVETAMSITFPS